MRKLVFIFILSLFLSLMHNLCYGLEKETHKALNDFILNNNASINTYLNSNLNLAGGLDTQFNGKKLRQWTIDGGAYEDEPMYTRSLNHFHDPLKPWISAGFKGVGISSAVWAQYPLQSQIINGSFSWNDARSYFYLALTAPSADSQANYYSLCFRGLGQLMHLVQDASVPAHTRNDFHNIYMYEDWLESIRTGTQADQTEFNSIVNTPALPVSSYPLSRVGYNPWATIPIAGLFDTDSYNGTNPGITPFNSVGLAEYSNANFFSEDTIFSSDYPYPAYSSTTIMDLPVGIDQGMTIYRPYYYKTGDGDSGYPLATDGFLGWYVHNYIPAYDYILLTNFNGQALDEQCYDTYARRLLPDAIAYSSALLQYFFRGQIDAVDAATTTDSSGDINGMTLKVKNTTPGEEMTANGSSHFVVAYNYKDSGGNTVYGKSDDVTLTANIPTGNTTTDDTYKYTFNFSSPIPPDATEPHYMLVYRGKLGQEDDAVAGKGFQGGPIILEDNFGYNWAEPDDSIYSHPAGPYKGIQSFYCNLYQLYGWWGSPRPAAYYEPIRVGWITGDALPKVGDKYLLTGIRVTGVLKSFSISLYDFSSKTAPAPGQYSWEFIARIYKNNGNLPGELVAVSLPSYYTGLYGWQTGSPTGGWGGNIFVLENPLYIPKDATYNIEVEVLSKGDLSSNLAIFWDDGSGIPSYISEAGGDYIQQNGSMSCDFRFDPSLNPIASRIYDKPIPFPTDGKIKFWVNSKVAGNVIDFIWGKEGPDYSQPVTINQAGVWEEHEIDVSATSLADRSQLRFIGFRRGKDAYSYSCPPFCFFWDYWNVPNEIYFDHIFE